MAWLQHAYHCIIIGSNVLFKLLFISFCAVSSNTKATLSLSSPETVKRPFIDVSPSCYCLLFTAHAL